MILVAEHDLVADQGILQIEGISKSFHRQPVLRHTSLHVNEGEFLSLLGPSGCGKTTLLRIIAGLETADSGSLLFNSQEVSNWPAAKRNFGIVFQSYALYPNMTALENVGFGLRAHGFSKKEWTAQSMEMLIKVGLADSAHKVPSQLSGGQQQRVALARVLVLSPRLLLLDEPFSALDARVRLQMRLQVREMQRELGVTTILVTHDQEEAMMVSDRVALMRAGEIEQIGTPQEIYQAPQSEFTADFIGTMNFFRGSQVQELISDLSPYENWSLGVRPESFRLSSGNTDEYTLSVTLVDLEFHGSLCRAIAQTESGLQILSELPPQVLALPEFRPGATLQLSVNARAVLRYQNGILQNPREAQGGSLPT